MSGSRADAKYTAALVLTISLFALWGFGHQLYDVLLSRVGGVLGLQRYQLIASQNVYSTVYLLGALPGAILAWRFGFKATILFGLGSFCVGAFILYPATEMRSFDYFLAAISVMACGWILLEVTANPLIAGFGSVETAVRRLNVAQSFYPLGGLLGLGLGRWILDADLAMPAARLTQSVVHPYIMLGLFVLVLAFLISEARFPAAATDHVKQLRGLSRDLRALFTDSTMMFAVAAQLCSILALVTIWSTNTAYMAEAFPAVARSTYAGVFLWSYMAFGVGRIAGSALMFRFDPRKVLTAFSLGGLLVSAVAAFTLGSIGAVAMIASSFFVSITWPSVLGIAIGGKGNLMKLGTALICMGGALGGFAHQLLASTLRLPAVHLTMIITVACFAVILAFAIGGRTGASATRLDN